MPETIFNKIKNNINKQWLVCFYTAIVVGLIAHLYKITNWLPNWDSLVFRYDAQNMLGIGRWFLPVACGLSSFYDLPFLNGLLAIVLHGLGAVCICRMLDVKKNLTAFLIGGTIASFPVVTSVMMYNYVADGYSLAFLFSCLAAMLLVQEKPKYIVSVILIMLSAGIYQAYITVTIMLILLHLADELIHKNKSAKEITLKSLKILVSGALGMALYYGVLTALLKITGTELLEYQGLDSTAKLSNINIFASLYVIKEALLNYFFDFSKGVSAFAVINALIFAMTLIGYVAGIVKNKVYLSVTKLLLLAALVVLLPLCSTVLAFINAQVDYHNLMKMGYCVFYIFLIILYERMEFCDIKKTAIKSWGILILVCALITNQVVISNISYHVAQISYEKSYGTLIRICDRIEQTEGANDIKEVVVIGAMKDSENYSAILPPDMTGITEGLILRADDEIVGQSVLCSAINDYCGKDYKFLAGERKAEFLNNPKVSEMECWPASDSIAVFDDVLVIKLGLESE